MIGAWLAAISGSSQSTVYRSYACDRFFKVGAVCVTTLLLGLFVAVPIWAILHQGLVLPDGSWGLGNFVDYFRDPRFVTITSRSLLLATSATVITIVLAFGYAYALVRTLIPLKSFWRFCALLPIFAPSLVQALGIQFLLGRNGLIQQSARHTHRHLRLLGNPSVRYALCFSPRGPHHHHSAVSRRWTAL